MSLQSIQHQIPLHLINTLACCWRGGDARRQPEKILRQYGELLLSIWSPIENLVAPSLPSDLEQVLCRTMELRRVGAPPLLLTAAECSGAGRRLPVLATAADTVRCEFPEAEQILGRGGSYLTAGYNDRQCQQARDFACSSAERGQRVLVLEVLETTAGEWRRATAAIGLGLWWWRSTALSPPDPVG